jgi:hypothetical protein
MTTQPQSKSLLTVGLVVILAVVGFYVLNAPDRRTPGERIGDAVDQLGDRTPGEKLGDAVKDVGADLKKAPNRQ